MSRLGWKTRPTLRADLQVAAAVGQMRLMNIYEASFPGTALTRRKYCSAPRTWRIGRYI